MNRRRKFWRRSTGVTLVEVLVALSLLGSLAVAMVLSRGQLMDQHRRAEQKQEAVRVADTLLAGWWAEDHDAFPVGDEGPIESHDGWVWETQLMPKRELEPFGARAVRLRILDTKTPGDPVELTSVELVLPARGTP